MRLYVKKNITKINPSFSRKNCIGYQPDAVVPFLFVPMYDGPSEDTSTVHFCTDISIILNQQRLTKELQPLVDDILSRSSSGDLSDSFPHLSDDDIISTIKSRYLQAPCEIRDWSTYLVNELKSLEADKAIDHPSEPSPTAEPTATNILSSSSE